MAPDASGGGRMMARLIDADAAKLTANDYKIFRCQLGGLVDVVEFLDDMPTVDAVPVSELEKLRDYLYAEDLIFMRGLAELNKLIAKYGAKMVDEVIE